MIEEVSSDHAEEVLSVINTTDSFTDGVRGERRA